MEKIDKMDELWHKVCELTGISTYYLNKIVDWVENNCDGDPDNAPQIFGGSTDAQETFNEWWALYVKGEN